MKLVRGSAREHVFNLTVCFISCVGRMHVRSLLLFLCWCCSSELKFNSVPIHAIEIPSTYRCVVCNFLSATISIEE